MATVAAQKGRDVLHYAFNTLKKELKELPESMITEVLSNIFAWLVEVGYDITEVQVKELFADGLV